MGRGIIGESGANRAMDKMIKHMERSDRQAKKNGPKAKEDNSIVAQLKAIYPDTWQEELDEMLLEHNSPEYLKAKQTAAEEGRSAYYNQSRAARDTAGLTEQQFINRYVRQWKRDNRHRFEKK